MSIRKLHPRDVMLIRRLKVVGWSDERIWKEYRISMPVIQKAKKEIQSQAIEEFDNKGLHAVELAKWKERLKVIIDNMDSIANDKDVSHADRLKSESIKLEALSMLQNAIEVSISSLDPYTARKKIVEHSDSHHTPNIELFDYFSRRF